MAYTFFESIGYSEHDRNELKKLASSLKIPLKKLDFYNTNQILPTAEDLNKIESETGIKKETIMLKMGIFDKHLLTLISEHSDLLIEKLATKEVPQDSRQANRPNYETPMGSLYHGDCIDVMKGLESNSVDLIFADPPFNLNKFYKSEINDSLTNQEYINWSYDWIDECIRILKDGGSFFLWNLPKWNAIFSKYLSDRLNFKHWISTDIKYSLPISGKLYPSHYSLLYYTKGEKASSFHPDRLPMEICPKCHHELKDYGGYKNKMNPAGINLSDVWYDIPPVRHSKYKKRAEANELSIKLLDRIIEMSSEPDDVVFDPFGGSGTTYVVAELKGRKWLGVELGPVDDIISRFEDINSDLELLNKYRKNYNSLFPSPIKEKRKQLNLWTDDSFVDNSAANSNGKK